ncbi:hypothetical protein F441_10818 [Phytophthora nicotianae CJ01A1]|uniref:Uncharacterized protein n=6 Tax=Phytophthora nicotianae TaxID=4792 RepID=W2Z5Q4_PHYNI|nr:hypothetical protein L915_10629 [Phytophthora nicotianae]ETL37846.1 hypothetical protein L916_10519 [Phytophthora nicotianae]ETO73097.1 hypothetical protein F444_10952 [Phytophthora nicotianae P1976]ETP14228.1 hypothetical protein F441_10818 [Phytophthora nicotianae CJ01A1]ETP42276.1 hypothetical protein F442_10796 [Phytophthora nicotianae P10297]
MLGCTYSKNFVSKCSTVLHLMQTSVSLWKASLDTAQQGGAPRGHNNGGKLGCWAVRNAELATTSASKKGKSAIFMQNYRACTCSFPLVNWSSLRKSHPDQGGAYGSHRDLLNSRHLSKGL